MVNEIRRGPPAFRVNGGEGQGFVSKRYSRRSQKKKKGVVQIEKGGGKTPETESDARLELMAKRYEMGWVNYNVGGGVAKARVSTGRRGEEGGGLKRFRSAGGSVSMDNKSAYQVLKGGEFATTRLFSASQ